MIDSVPEHRRCLIEFAAHSRILRAGAGIEEDNLGALARNELAAPYFRIGLALSRSCQSSTRLFSIRCDDRQSMREVGASRPSNVSDVGELERSVGGERVGVKTGEFGERRGALRGNRQAVQRPIDTRD